MVKTIYIDPTPDNLAHITIAMIASDDCRMFVQDPENKDGWELDIPRGFKVVCPHGFVAMETAEKTKIRPAV